MPVPFARFDKGPPPGIAILTRHRRRRALPVAFPVLLKQKTPLACLLLSYPHVRQWPARVCG
jgi:hypothetical protein